MSLSNNLPSFLKDLISSFTGGKDPFHNLTALSVPTSLLLAAWPHWYTIYLAQSNGIQGGWSNINPRAFVVKLAQKPKPTPLELLILRGQACQANSFENVPLFLAALVWANYTRLEVETINSFILGYLASRVLYTVLYLKTSTYWNSFARTVVFNFGILCIVSIWIRGGLALAPSLK
ncbi:hypothetical protein NDA18_005221 [Ustilago nuda]|nr:hypothetical protein NDA18_005221 [Ustilago nuda]